MISVIVPCYNNAAYLGKCIDSILAQTYRNFEVIVVDDGSNDNPRAILANYSDARVRNIIELPHQGVSNARNKGIEQAEGQYIVFIDGDDYIERNHLESLHKDLHQVECAMVIMEIVDEDGYPIDIPDVDFFCNHSIIESSSFNQLLSRELLSSPCNKIYQTDIIRANNIQFDRKVSYAEDLLFNLEYFKYINNVKLVPLPTYYYVKHNNSGTTRCHNNIAYTLSQLTNAVATLLGNGIDNYSLKFLLNKYIWGISSLYHSNSTLNGKEKINELKTIYNLPLYSKALSQLDEIHIDSTFKMLLKIKKAWLTHKAFKYRK